MEPDKADFRTYSWREWIVIARALREPILWTDQDRAFLKSIRVQAD